MIYDSAMKLRECLRTGAHANLSGICRKAVSMFADCCAEGFLRIDNRIPCFELDEGCLTGGTKSLWINSGPPSPRGAFILNSDLEYKIQWASLLMDVDRGLADEEKRTVFRAVLPGRIRTLQRRQK